MRRAIWKILFLCVLNTPVRAAPADGTLPASGIDGCDFTAAPTAPAAQVSAGCARAFPLPGNEGFVLPLLPLEAEARASHRGLWADPRFAVRAPKDAGQLLDSYGIVEGTVTSASKTKDHVYLNFGIGPAGDWKTDFTVELTKPTARALLANSTDWQTLGGRRLRVHGWVFWRYGPAMLATSPAQIEIWPLAQP